MRERSPSNHVLSMLRGLSSAANGSQLDIDLDAPHAPAPAESEPAWQGSTRDLLRGVDVTDFSETISGDVFQELFRR